MDLTLNGKVAMITGGSRGLGQTVRPGAGSGGLRRGYLRTRRRHG